MAPVVRRIYDQMLEPKWAIAMGACSSSMGVFNNYAIVPADKFMPVDIHVPGCPPRPEALVYGILKLRAMVMAKPDQGWRTRYGGRGTEEFDRVRAGRSRRRVPDATGLELIAQELRERDAESVLDTVYFRDKAALTVTAGLDPRDARVPARQGLQLPGEPSTAWTTSPRSRGSACTTSCSTCTRSTGSRSRSACRIDAPNVPSVVDGVADRRPPGARGLRHVRRDLRRPPGPAPDPDARGLRGLPAAARLPDGRRGRALHPQRAADARGGGE